MKNRTIAAVFAALSVVTGAHAAGQQDFAKAVEQRYRAVEAAIQARDGARWLTEFYSPEAVVVGEGSKETLRGHDALRPVVNGIVKETRSCTIRPDSTRQASADLGYSFVTYQCSPADAAAADYQVRALFVWKKTQAGWRVVAESYTMGSM
ncbi:YybH family protein [Aromatoleum bremense]|uniref:DUF4440 domain-containing protein n=1 Tax=Aromatoleum bremense TaxID=76115 RepID=A0ABX1P063_9RHOO|nr:nuclear transport factor 2 family protein [Aromatoleum bremense]NMG17042.1 DUF4440 domain-containing protein [Aromatoleum bremense]QTQ34144.1 SnoaL-like domain-containing protein [Aromatoleum bremense]